VSGSEAWLAGHFPGHPIVPGVLMAEALAQFSGLVGVGAAARAPNTTPGATKLAHIDIRFDQPVIPPAEIILESRLLRMVGPLKMFEVGARVGGVVVCRGTLALHGSDEPGGGNRPA